MKYTIENINTENKFLFFWGHQPSKDGTITKTCFSQWWKSSFTVEGIEYKTAEHWMMAKKALLFDDKEQYENILANESPAMAKKYGRAVKNFDDVLWKENCYQLVVEGNIHKFSQNKNLKEFLLNTDNQIIVEASPFDKIWGIGTRSHIEDPKQWKGLNLLGFALMEVRDELRKNNEKNHL
ncbi:NADAR family protein [Flavobacterium sp. HNIBRBA15423]|uniref:NADAR family protein n=1 Tax=Flavobacterium sp. HNIBRBA15423 TaxID=3458683 RepID=UPI004043C55D